MNEKNECYSYFILRGEFDPVEITTRVGVPPTEFWRKGDICPRSRRVRLFSKWSLNSRLDHGQELEAHIKDVMVQLEASREAFAAVSEEFGGILVLVGYFNLEYPGLEFNRDITRQLAHFSLEVDFDFYWPNSRFAEDDGTKS